MGGVLQQNGLINKTLTFVGQLLTKYLLSLYRNQKQLFNNNLKNNIMSEYIKQAEKFASENGIKLITNNVKNVK